MLLFPHLPVLKPTDLTSFLVYCKVSGIKCSVSPVRSTLHNERLSVAIGFVPIMSDKLPRVLLLLRLTMPWKKPWINPWMGLRKPEQAVEKPP